MVLMVHKLLQLSTTRYGMNLKQNILRDVRTRTIMVALLFLATPAVPLFSYCERFWLVVACQQSHGDVLTIRSS